MNINLNNQYAVLRSSAYDINQVAKTQSKIITQIAAGSQTADPTSAGVQAGSVLKLRNSGLRLRSIETGVVNAMSYLETQAGVFRQMADVVARMSQLGSQMVDPSKNAGDVQNYFEEFSELQDELSSYRTAQFNGRNLMNYLSEGSQGPGTATEMLPVALSQEANKTLNITQSDVRTPGGPFNDLLGEITTDTTPNRDPIGDYSASQLVDEALWGQKGFDNFMQDISRRMAVNQTEQSQLRLNLDRIRERMLGTDAATSRVADVDVAQELTVLARTDMQFRGAIATKTQSNVLADSALQILSNQDFSSPLIQEARLATASTRSLIG
jgi:flagellin-like hook-associated protein FlgL